MDLGLKGKKAVVLAASKGLGKAAALALAKEGCSLAVCSRNPENLNQAVTEIREQTKAPVFAETVDVSDQNSLLQFMRKSADALGGLDILITNAGGPPVKSFEESTEEEWHYWYEVTFMTVVRSVKSALPIMKKQKWGRIINITSISVKAPVERLIYSNALRLAVVGLAKSLSMEVGQFGITVNNVAPGYHLTDGLERIIRKRTEAGEDRQDILSDWENKIPMKRIGLPGDLAALITFLASEQASYITGTTIQADGGLYSGAL
ncbi:MAG: SDR family oxidoreductase [Calditrichaeota bacterium]|nr:SDR family oxidoreductase [Calditrichota bacterium]